MHMILGGWGEGHVEEEVMDMRLSCGHVCVCVLCVCALCVHVHVCMCVCVHVCVCVCVCICACVTTEQIWHICINRGNKLECMRSVCMDVYVCVCVKGVLNAEFVEMSHDSVCVCVGGGECSNQPVARGN